MLRIVITNNLGRHKGRVRRRSQLVSHLTENFCIVIMSKLPTKDLPRDYRGYVTASLNC
jgi:hypothetical protein